MPIKPLPVDVVAQIKSAVAITSLNSVVLGLVKNSLDAEATKIQISLDYRKGTCSVEDNGLGVAPAEFLDSGGLGKLYYTSKYPPRYDCFGSHGTFLPSVAALSLLSVTSHHHEHHSHNSLSIHNSKVVARNTPAPPEHRLLSFPHGTRVTVRDLFGSMPVRVKQRALETERSGSARELDHLVLNLLAILLVWPGKSYIGVRDAAGSNVLSLRTTDAPNSLQSQSSRKVALARLPRLLAQASLCDFTDAESWVEVGAAGLGVSVRGCVCLHPTATKRLQFMAIGLEPLCNERRTNVLFEEMNHIFADSSFGVIEGDSDEGSGSAHQKDRALRIRDLKARKGIDRWPIFSLQISLADGATDHALEVEDLLDGRSHNLTVITDLLRTLAYQFLKKHHFRPRPLNTVLRQDSTRYDSEAESVLGRAESMPPEGRRGSISPSFKDAYLWPRKPEGQRVPSPLGPIPTRARSSESPFDSWSRVKVGRSLSAAKANQQVFKGDSGQKRPLVDDSGRLIRKPFGDVELTKPKSIPTITGEGNMSKTQSESNIVWVDPINKIRSTIDSRTGFVLQSDSMTGKRISLPVSSIPPEHSPRPEPAPWIKDILSTWRNPAFALTEAPILRVPDPLEILPGQPHVKCASANNGLLNFGDAFEAPTAQLEGRVSKQALRDANVISQVDSKFILVSVTLQSAHTPDTTVAQLHDPDSGAVLVLIDQHAADERCRVEALQKTYFPSATSEPELRIACTEQIEKPIQFELTKKEGLLLVQYKDYFQHWGIVYSVMPEYSDLSRCKAQPKTMIQVQSLPPSVLERCRLEPRLLIELMRKEAWRLCDEPGLAITSTQGGDGNSEAGENDWVRRFRGCPQGVLDLINSRACRSAIMFNDSLSIDRCQDLVIRLANCVFPFQCAHGRPSMVPLLDLGSWTDFGSPLPQEAERVLVEGMRNGQ